MATHRDEVLKWVRYEQTKNKNFIDFSKNPEMRDKFINLVKTIKLRSSNA